jgi:two-component system sensor histidine kinase/response regulator
VLAERHAHTLKGVAGNLGAREAGDAAARLEHAISSGSPEGDVHTLLATLTGALERLQVAVLDHLGPEEERPVVAEPVLRNDASWAEATSTMRQLLTDFDPAATEFFEANRVSFEARLDPDAYAALVRHVEAYEFAEALGLLESGLA